MVGLCGAGGGAMIGSRANTAAPGLRRAVARVYVVVYTLPDPPPNSRLPRIGFPVRNKMVSMEYVEKILKIIEEDENRERGIGAT
jgi:hypothetical protein